MPDTAIICRIIGHRHAKRLWQSGDGYRSTCKRCGIELGRSRGEAQWRVVGPDG